MRLLSVFPTEVQGERKPQIYNLDMILSVGYRVNSKRGIAFRKWANNVLKQFILQGYAINEKRLQALKKTVDIQSRMLAELPQFTRVYLDRRRIHPWKRKRRIYCIL